MSISRVNDDVGLSGAGLTGGLKLFLPTLRICCDRKSVAGYGATASGQRGVLHTVILAKNWAFTDRRQYSGSPGRAVRRMANSLWNMSIDVRGGFGMDSSLNTKGLEIWYGVLLMQTSNWGKSSLMASPSSTSSFFCDGVPCTRLLSSAAIPVASASANPPITPRLLGSYEGLARRRSGGGPFRGFGRLCFLFQDRLRGLYRWA